MKKIIRNIIVVIYAIIAIFVTICLLSYNSQKVTELGNYVLVIIDNNELSPNYEKGDLAIIDKNKDIEIGDSVFFYDTNAKDFTVAFANVENKEIITDKETTYTLKGNKKISSEYVVGSSNSTVKIAKVGSILKILESKWGFLLLVVLPALLAFLYEIIEIIAEARNGKKTNENEKS